MGSSLAGCLALLASPRRNAARRGAGSAGTGAGAGPCVAVCGSALLCSAGLVLGSCWGVAGAGACLACGHAAHALPWRDECMRCLLRGVLASHSCRRASLALIQKVALMPQSCRRAHAAGSSVPATLAPGAWCLQASER